MARAVVLAALLGTAGVHAWLVAGHAGSEPVLAAAFGTAAALALALAALLASRPDSRAVGAAAAALLAALLVGYAADRTVGLPGAGDHAAAHGHTEASRGGDLLGVATKLVEGGGLAAALALLATPGRGRRSSSVTPA
jgi:hypothetical protein